MSSIPIYYVTHFLVFSLIDCLVCTCGFLNVQYINRCSGDGSIYFLLLSGQDGSIYTGAWHPIYYVGCGIMVGRQLSRSYFVI